MTTIRTLLGSVLYRELVDVGFARAYTTMIGELRRLELRPVCKVCQHRRPSGDHGAERAG